MARNILLTSLNAMDSNLPVRYFSLQKEFGSDYCDALLDTEAGIKAALARFHIDEVIVIGEAGTCNHQENGLTSVPLTHGRSLYSADKASFSTYDLLLYRLAMYADELAPDHKEQDELLLEEAREKLIRFIQKYQEDTADLKDRKFNRLFDALAQDDQAYARFEKAIFEAHPEFQDYSVFVMQWVKNYLYRELKPTAKLELLPVNENVSIRFIPENKIEDGKQWVESMMQMEKSIVTDQEDVNLFVSLSSNDAADTFIVLNMLNILVSMPKNNVHLQKIFTVRPLQRCMAGIIRDDTKGYGVTELFHSIRAFLKYGKADMIADLWEKSGERNESIAGMVYAMRHVDVGLSMCNIPEVEDGILRLKKLFKDEKFWRESGYYGMMFSVIAESIREDYGPLLSGDSDISFIDLVKWAYRHQFYQQTLTLIESRAPENLVKTGMFYYCNDEKQVDQVTRLFAKQRLELKPYEFYKMDQIDHYFIKSYNRSANKGGGRDEDPQRSFAILRARSLQNDDPALITGYTACDSVETLQNILFAYYHIGYVRNKISHAETGVITESRLMTSADDESSALVWMKDGIDYFIDCYEKALAEVQNKHPKVVLITGDEVRKAADRLKYEKYKDGNK